MAEPNPALRKQLFKTARLWALSLVCALAGSTAIWATDSIGSGVLAFLGALLVLGPILWWYERRVR